MGRLRVSGVGRRTARGRSAIANIASSTGALPAGWGRAWIGGVVSRGGGLCWLGGGVCEWIRIWIGGLSAKGHDRCIGSMRGEWRGKKRKRKRIKGYIRDTDLGLKKGKERRWP